MVEGTADFPLKELSGDNLFKTAVIVTWGMKIKEERLCPLTLISWLEVAGSR